MISCRGHDWKDNFSCVYLSVLFNQKSVEFVETAWMIKYIFYFSRNCDWSFCDQAMLFPGNIFLICYKVRLFFFLFFLGVELLPSTKFLCTVCVGAKICWWFQVQKESTKLHPFSVSGLEAESMRKMTALWRIFPSIKAYRSMSVPVWLCQLSGKMVRWLLNFKPEDGCLQKISC